jgi:hypothetical protein
MFCTQASSLRKLLAKVLLFRRERYEPLTLLSPSGILREKIRAMREEKVPLCDCHYRKMSPHVSTLFPAGVFKCVSMNCGRYYATRYGYFNLIPGEWPAAEMIDPADRQMKVCSTKQHAHSYLAITRPKNSGPGTKALWRWHCYPCSTTR